MTKLITIDNGGTLTDVCVMHDDNVTYTKTLTTPHDLSRCLFDGLAKVAADVSETLPGLLQSTEYVRYSTTQGTNALVQRTGPKLGLLVTNPGLREAMTPDAEATGLYDALVGDRSAVIDLTQDDDGLTAALIGACNDLTARGASRLVVSVCGGDGPAGERRIRSLLLALYPRQLLGAVPLLFSNDLVGGDPDDARRTWTSLLNSYLHPAMERFLFQSERRLREHRPPNPLLVFRNDGASSRVAKSAAIRTYSSGPRGGVEGTRALAAHYGLGHAVMVDVGGTTTDVAEIAGGQVRIDRHGQVGGVTTSLQLARIVSHGLGGSSVFHVVDGAVTVGPDSVGAAPGPACFGLGGTEATLTDVLLLTGVITQDSYLDGSMTLDATRSEAAVRAGIADPLGVDLPEALARMADAFADQLAEALRPVVQPDTTVVAIGGAGPMSICPAARRAGVARVLIPRSAAVFSAFGIGFSDIGQSYSAAIRAGADTDQQAEVWENLSAAARRDMYAEGLDLADCDVTWHFLPEDGEPVSLTGRDDLTATLADGGSGRLQIQVIARLPHPILTDTEATGQPMTDGATRHLREPDGEREVPTYRLTDQTPGATAEGPAVIEGPFFTMQLPAGWRAEITPGRDLLLTDTQTEPEAAS